MSVRFDERKYSHSQRPDRASFEALGALLAAPLSFLVSESIRYAIVPVACRHGWGFAALHIGALVALAVAAAGALVAGRRLRQQADEPESGHHFLSVLALLACALFGLAIFAQWLPSVVVGPCQH